MTSKEFKAEYVKYYKSEKKLEKLQQDIDNVYYQLSGVKGIDYSKQHFAFNKDLSQEERHRLIELVSIMLADLKRIKANCELMAMLIPKFTQEEINILNRILIDGESYDRVGFDYGYSASTMWRYVESFIEAVIS